MKFTEEYVKVFGLWLGSKLKSHKNASIDELFKEFNDKYPPSNQRDHDRRLSLRMVLFPVMS